MTTFVTPTSSTQHTPVHKIRRKPAPTLLSPITPITPLRAPNVPSGETPPKADLDNPAVFANMPLPSMVSTSVSPSSKSNTKQPQLIDTLTISTSLFTNLRYPPPDPDDPFAPLSVLRDRSRRCSTNAMLSSSYTFAAGSNGFKDENAGMTSTDNLSVASSTKSSFLPLKAARTLGAIRAFPNDFIKEKKKSEHPQKRVSMCSLELYPDPPSSRGLDTNKGQYELMMGKNNKGSTAPHYSVKTPKATATKPDTLGHYTPHSRQRTRSSISALSSPSSLTVHLSNKKQHVLIPAPDVYALPSLVRDRSESSASGTSSSGTGYQSTSDPATTIKGSLPPPSTSYSSFGRSDASPLDVSGSYALTMALLNSPQKHTRSRSSSRERSGYERDVEIEQTPKAGRTKKIENCGLERAASPASSMFKIARFFTGGGKVVSRKNSFGSLRLLDGSPSSKVEKRKSASPKSKGSPSSRGRARTRKLSVASVNISGPVFAPVSIPLGENLRQHAELPLYERPTSRPRSQTTPGLPPSTLASRLRHGPPSAKASSVTVGAIGTSQGNISSDQDIEEEINKEADISRLKPWTASIPRKRSSLSLSILPTPAIPDMSESSDDACETTAGRDSCFMPRGDLPHSLAMVEPRMSKGSRESAVSAGSIGSSYIQVADSAGQSFAKSDIVLCTREEEDCTGTWPRRNPIPPRSKTEGLLKTTANHGIAGIKFPGFRRAQTSVQDLIHETPYPSSTSGSVRGLKISSPIMRSTGSTGPSSKLISPLVSRSTAPPVNPPTNRHERTISDSDCSLVQVDEPIRIAPPKNHTSSAQAQVPTASELETLLTLPLLDEHGQKIEFGDILNAPAKDSEKTVIVLFIRHFWCPLDQDYVQEVVDILRRLSEDNGGWELATSDGGLRIGCAEGKKAIPEVVIISNGSPALIAKYKEIFDLAGKKGSNLKVKLYTDPTCRTYRILGMENVGEACISVTSTPIQPSRKYGPTALNSPDSPTSRSCSPYSKYDAGVSLARIDHRTPPRKTGQGDRKSRSLAGSPVSLPPRSDTPSPSVMLSAADTFTPAIARSISPLSASTHESPYKSYVKHTSTIGGIASVVLRAIKVGMPVWEKGGAIKQLGGELVFKVLKEQSNERNQDTGIQVACAFAHRMSDTQDHTPFGDVLKISLTARPLNNFISFRPSVPYLSPSSRGYSVYSSSEGISPHYEPSTSAPSHDRDRTSTSAPCSPFKPSRRGAQTGTSAMYTFNTGMLRGTTPTDEEEPLDDFPAEEQVMPDSVLDALKEGAIDTWGDKLHNLRSRMAGKEHRDVSDSIRAIRARDSVRSSTGSATDISSMRAMRAIQVPRGPRMRMQSASAESLTASRSQDTVRSFGSGMEGIETVLEYGESISSPDLSILERSKCLLRTRRAMDSTSTLNSSLYYDAHEGLLDIADHDEEEISRSVAVSVVPVGSRPASREAVNCPEVQDQTFHSIESCETTSSERTERLASVCSGTSEGNYEDNVEKLRELLMIRANANNSLWGRGVQGGRLANDNH